MQALQVNIITDYSGEEREMSLVISNADQLRWEKTRAAKGFPTQQEAPLTYSTFCAWSALKRSGEDVGTYEEFEPTVHFLTTEAIEVNPTTPTTTVG